MPQSLAEIIEELGSTSWGAIKNCRLLSLWSKVVDDRVQKNTDPVKIRNKVLYVSTTSSTWAQELSFLKQEIIKKFNQAASEEAIKDIRFVARGM